MSWLSGQFRSVEIQASAGRRADLAASASDIGSRAGCKARPSEAQRKCCAQRVLPGSAEAAVSGAAALPVKRSITERTASPDLRSLTASSSGAAAGARRIRLSGSGKIKGSSQGPCTTNGRSNADVLLAPPEVRLATPLRSYSRDGTDAVPVRVTREVGPSMRTSSAVAVPSLNFTETER